jgi:hypothetical protein
MKIRTLRKIIEAMIGYLDIPRRPSQRGCPHQAV